MPRRRRYNISQQTRNAIRLRNIGNQSTEEERQNAREVRRVRMARLRGFQKEEQREGNGPVDNEKSPSST